MALGVDPVTYSAKLPEYLLSGCYFSNSSQKNDKWSVEFRDCRPGA